MEFRWVALIALWTLLSGPVFDTPSGPAPGPRPQTAQAEEELHEHHSEEH
jgi:hypothetical protein